MIDQILDRHFGTIASLAANVGIDTAAKLPAANITVITSTRNLNKSKAIVDGNIKTVGLGTLFEGYFETKSLNINQLHQLIGCISINTALCNGTVKPEYKHVEAITTSNNLTKKEFADGVNTIARSKDYFEYNHQAGWLFIDCDRPDLTLAQCYSLLIFLMPELRTAPTIGVTSSSAGIYNVTAPPPVDVFGGAHFYILIDDASFIPVIGQILNYRCWLNPKVSGIDLGIPADFKFATVSVKPNGTIKKSPLFDSCVYQAERLIYEAAPTLSNDLARKERVFAKINSDADALNTNSFYFSDTQQLELDAIIDAAMLSVKTESDKLKSIIKREQKSQLISSGHTELEAEIIVNARENGILSGNTMLKPDKYDAVSVADILKAPEKYHNATFSDPDGNEQCKAQLYFNDNGTVVLHSFAHGECDYFIVDYSCVEGFLKLKTLNDSPPKKLNPLELKLREISLAPKAQLNHLWRKLAIYLANRVPNEYTFDVAVGVVSKAMLERGLDVKNAATLLIQKTVNANKDKVKLLHLLPQQTLDAFGVASYDVTGLNVDEVATKMRDLYLQNPTMFIDTRGMGAGKTNTLKALAKLLDVNIVYVTHRVTLVADAAQRLNFVSYKAITPEGYYFRPSTNLAVCLNSLANYNTNRVTVVFIDEARQVYETLVACSTIKHRQTHYDNFKSLLQRTNMVVLADAGMNSDALSFYNECRGHKTLAHITAVATTDTKNYKWLSSHDTSRNSALQDLKTGKRGVVACTSSKQAVNTHTYFLLNGIAKDRLMLITGDETDYPHVKEFLSNPNRYAVDYDCIIYTPAVVSGVSLEIVEFEFTYLLCSNVLPANESMQMLARNRYAKDVYVSFGKQLGDVRVTDIEVLKEGYLKKVAHLSEDNGLDISAINQNDIKLNDLAMRRIQLSSNTNYDLNNFKRTFMLLAEIEGKNFVEVIDEIKIIGLNDIVKADEIAGILDATDITEENYSQLNSRGCVSKDETFAKKRHDVKHMVGNETINENDIENYLDGVNKRLTNFENLHRPTKELREIDKRNFESKDKMVSFVSRQKLVMPMVNYLLKQEAIGKKQIDYCMKYLKKHHCELSEFGKFNRENIKQPLKIVSAFLKKFGYELFEIKRTENERFYELKVNDDIALYASNRADLKAIEKMTVNSFFLIKNQPHCHSQINQKTD